MSSLRHRLVAGRCTSSMTLPAFALVVSTLAVLPAGWAEAQTVVTIAGHYPDGFTVPAGETWQFDPNQSTTVTSGGNVIVRGTLQMRPNSSSVVHTLEFTGISEGAFVGKGGAAPVPEAFPNDVGLWVVDGGKLDVQGTPKVPWGYSWQSGWAAADDIRAVPNNQGNYSVYKQIDGAADVPAANVKGHKPELLNLTRNVVIRGTASGKSHVFIQSSQPQTIKYVTIQHVAPDFLGDDATGRYGLHIHMMDHASRGSLIEGVVIRDAAGHAFVPHASHGVTFKNTISFNTVGEAYWWDESTGKSCPAGDPACNASNDILYDGVVAAKTIASPYSKHESAAFQLGAGVNPAIVNSVVVGMIGTGDNNSGFKWPSQDRGEWFFVNNIAHNNAAHGIFVWQNTTGTHVIDGFTAYYNKDAGVDHGAYNNSYVYKNLALEGNAPAVESHALGRVASDKSTDTQQWLSVDFDGGNVETQLHQNVTADSKPVRFAYCKDLNKVVFDEIGPGGGGQPGKYDFVNCGLAFPADFTRANIHPGTVVRVQNGPTAYTFTGKGGSSPIPLFFDTAANPPPPPPDPTPPPPVGGAGPGGFFDTAGSIFGADIAWLAAMGITKGCNPPANTLFCPKDLVTRGAMAAFLNRALDLPANSQDVFVDDGDSVFEGDINALARAGITKGCDPPANTMFCPDRSVTRAEMAAFLVRALGLAPGPDKFVDDAGSIFQEDINALAWAQITLGCNPPRNDHFCPDDHVTREQMAAFLHRADELLPGAAAAEASLDLGGSATGALIPVPEPRPAAAAASSIRQLDVSAGSYFCGVS